MTHLLHSRLPELPVLLWKTPPGLELALAQEGLPFLNVEHAIPHSFQSGRFVLHDGRRVKARTLRTSLSSEHVLIDVDQLRGGEKRDPLEMLVDLKPGRRCWEVDGVQVVERVSRYAKGEVRRRLVARLREILTGAGGVWARLATLPYPYRSAFNFRIDLDEPVPADYFALARIRKPIDDCMTYFISTHAYGDQESVLGDLAGRDTQSHGHYHIILRDEEANFRNIERARLILDRAGLGGVGFAAPHGRWTPGLDRALEKLGYRYSSDFSIGYDDLPFFPWLGERFSRVLQVPIHPICEGLFFDAGASDVERLLIDHFKGVVETKLGTGEPIFLYGHPERRLARLAKLPAALGSAIAGEALLWRVTMTEFADWWRWRAERRWSLVRRDPATLEVQFEDWEPRYPLGIEITRGTHTASLPLTGPKVTLRLDKMAFERRRIRADAPAPAPVPRQGLRAGGLRHALREAIDWETTTPLEDLPSRSFADKLKKNLRRYKKHKDATNVIITSQEKDITSR